MHNTNNQYGSLKARVCRKIDDCTSSPWRVFYNAYNLPLSCTNVEGQSRISYDYSPYGAVTETSTTDTNTNNITQALQWSSEIYDFELVLSYYNYRHYNPTDGRWINRDPIQEQGGWNLYEFVHNELTEKSDYLGLKWEVKLTENLNVRGRVSVKGTGRGVTRIPLVIPNNIKYKISKDNRRCYNLNLDGSVIIEVLVAAAGDDLYKEHLQRYDKKWGKDRTDNQEREAVIAHEYDHSDSMIKGFKSEVDILNEKYDNKKYHIQLAAEKEGKEVMQKVTNIYNHARMHALTFDVSPNNQGAMYATNPFIYKP